MIIFGEVSSIPDDEPDLLIYNLSSLMEGFVPVAILPPSTQMNYSNEKEFDYLFMNYILNNDSIFFEFFSKIMNPIYYGFDVFILVSRNMFFDMITESLMTFIDQRYGYKCAMINEKSDYDYVDKCTTFTTAGIYNFDIDKARYTNLYVAANINHINDDGSFDGKQIPEINFGNTNIETNADKYSSFYRGGEDV